MDMQKKSLSSVRIFYPKFSLEEIVKKLKEIASSFSKRLGIEKIILFGSYPNKRYMVASDIDLLVVINEQ